MLVSAAVRAETIHHDLDVVNRLPSAEKVQRVDRGNIASVGSEGIFNMPGPIPDSGPVYRDGGIEGNRDDAHKPVVVHCEGAGEPVYLIGGGPAFTTWNLAPVQQALAVHYRVCRWDMRGVGDNRELEISESQPVLMQWIDDMAQVLPEQPVTLWGHSWGALQALLFAKHYPQRVRALVLNNPVDPGLVSLKDIEARRYVHPYVESHLRIDDIGTPVETRHRFRSKIASYFMDPVLGWSYSDAFGSEDTNNALNVQIWEEYRRMMLTPADIDRLAPRVHTLIFCRQDVLMPESLAEYSRMLPLARHRVIEECAHFPWVETPKVFYERLLSSMQAIMQ